MPSPKALAAALRGQDIDVTTTADLNLLGSEDSDQLTVATRDGRVLVAHDRDFLRIAATGRHHAGIAYCHRESITLGRMIEELTLMHAVMDSAEMVDRVYYL